MGEVYVLHYVWSITFGIFGMCHRLFICEIFIFQCVYLLISVQWLLLSCIVSSDLNRPLSMFRVYLELQTSNLVDSRFSGKYTSVSFQRYIICLILRPFNPPTIAAKLTQTVQRMFLYCLLHFRCVISLTAGWTHWPMGDLGHSKGPNQTAAGVGFLGASQLVSEPRFKCPRISV